MPAQAHDEKNVIMIVWYFLTCSFYALLDFGNFVAVL